MDGFWKTKASYRVFVLAWKMWHNALLTFANVNAHYLHYLIECPFFGGDDDSLLHVLLRCDFAKAIWYGLDIYLKTSFYIFQYFHQWLLFWAKL